MHFAKTIIALAATLALAGASPVDSPIRARAVQDSCQDHLGACDQNGCNGAYNSPWDTTGFCTSGNYNGCPCEKCGGDSGFVGGCADNGCNGYQGTCQSGTFQGCPCK